LRSAIGAAPRLGGCASALRADRAIVRETEKLDHVLNAASSAQGYRHPAGVGQHMVRPGLALSDQFVAHPAGEREVGDPITVQVAELAAPEAKLDSAESVRSGLHTWPGHNGFGDQACGASLLVSHLLVLPFDV
jgi:hypothetical protein